VQVYVKLVLVKRTEKDAYKRKTEWQLRDLKVLHCKLCTANSSPGQLTD
jgi:hypothetical protein